MRSLISIVVFVVLAASCPAIAQRSTPVQLLHPAGAAMDQFGQSVAIDGDTMIVGAPLDDVGANASQGSAHVYRWTGAGWAFEATLTAADGAVSDLFGSSVAIEGDTVLVGAFTKVVDGRAGQGAAYVFVRSGSTWIQQARITASDGAADDRFGISVALSGNNALIGAAADDVAGNGNQGSAYVFARSGSTWTQQARLNAADGAAGDNFGFSVALSGDTLLVGANLDDVGGNSNQGSAYLFVRSGSTWTQQTRITATGGAASDQFGYTVALSGDTALVGAPLDAVTLGIGQGSAYVFARSGSTWSQQAQLNATNSAAGDNFGISVSLSSDTALVGAYFDDVGPNSNQGSATVFVRDGSTWTQQAQLTATSGLANDRFGFSVAISGDTALVGAYLDDEGANTDQGSAWTFSRVGSNWIGPDLSVLAADGAANDNFGLSVALSGSTALVGAPFDNVGGNVGQGSVYVFTRSGMAWTQQAQLTATGGALNDNFGRSVAISGDTALVGAPGDDVGAIVNQGSAYVFVRNGSTWSQQAQLNAADGAPNDSFGWSVALVGDTAILGANADDIGANGEQGSAYIFVRSGSTWTQQAQLTAADGAAGDLFGTSVALDGNTAVVGASEDGVGGNNSQGSAYVFTRVGSSWIQQAQLTASDGADSDDFGFAVAISGDTALVSAYQDDVGAIVNQGSAYVFTRLGTAWTQQARLTVADGAEGDRFGDSVAVSGNTALVGARRDDVNGNVDQGSAYVFTRIGSTWIQQAQLTGSAGGDGGSFGASVALSDTTAFVGARETDIGANSSQGSAWSFGVSFDDLSTAHNQTTSTSFLSISAAVLPALTGHQITATEGAWRTAGPVDTAGKSLDLRSTGDLRMVSGLALYGLSSISALPANVVELFSSVDIAPAAAATISGETFLLGSRGLMDLFAGSSLVVNAPTSRLVGRTVIELDASLSFLGDVAAIGDLSADDGSLLSTRGDFDCTLTSNTRYDMSLATLQMEGTGSEQTLEVMSTDIGADAAGLDRTLSGHYPIGTLQIGPSPSTVRLVDTHDNDGLGQSACEAIYVDTLIIEAGSRLINTTCRIYYNTLVNNGTVDVPGNLVSLVPPVSCDYDFNQDENVDLLDAQQMAQVFVGLITPEATWLDGDLNGDENADLTDAQLLAAYVVTGTCGI